MPHSETQPALDVRVATGVEFARHLDAIATLRIEVFRAWPYLYAGDMAYERGYLDAYAASADSVVVLAFDGDRVVGASTGIALADDGAEFQAPFRDAGLAVESVFYFGESVLLPAYRGRGIGHAFFDHREAHARALGAYHLTAFCSVERDMDDPRCPIDHRPNDAFWRKARLRSQARDDRAFDLEGNRRRRHRTCIVVLDATTGEHALKIAVAKYLIDAPRDFAAFADKQRRLLEIAAGEGATLAVLPEYLSLELAATFARDINGDLLASLGAIQSHRYAWLALYAQLARETGMSIAAGTFLLAGDAGPYRNRADLFHADGSHAWQDKLQLTGFEKQAAVIEGGEALKVFGGLEARLGIAVCYDIEFPLPVRAQCQAGARLLLVPSCTDTAAGAMRVRVGCMARALENRSFVAQAVTAGEAAWSPALDVNTGEATVYAPMDVDLPADGIVAQTHGDEVWAFADLDFDALEASRAHAQVANDRDWNGQLAPALTNAQVEHD